MSVDAAVTTRPGSAGSTCTTVATDPGARARWLVVPLCLLLASCGAPLLDLVSATPRVARTLQVGGSTLRVEITTDAAVLPVAAYEAWVEHAADMVVDYYGRFPVPTLRVRILTGGFGGVGFGQHYRGERVGVLVGTAVDERVLARDWVLVHEMLHAAFPRVGRRHRWMQEGLSTYLETVVRLRSGVLSEEEAWSHLWSRLPVGLPGPGDRGLDHTHTWARTYWGGALFWLVVDVELRVATAGRRSLRDALTAILEAGGSGRARWSPDEVVRIADEATGTEVVSSQYRALAERPGRVDLESLLGRLGVRPRGGSVSADTAVSLDDAAELASVRRAIGGLDAVALVEAEGDHREGG